jgi:hypothetical protein
MMAAVQTFGSVHADLVLGSGPRFSAETQGLLRRRLSAVALILFLGSLLFLVRGLFLQDLAVPRELSIGVALCLAVAVILCNSRRELSLKALRVLELIVFGLTILHVAANHFGAVSRTILAGQDTLLLSQFERPVLPCLVLVLLYGTMIPNTLRRAAWVIIPIGLVPLLVRFGLSGLQGNEFLSLIHFVWGWHCHLRNTCNEQPQGPRVQGSPAGTVPTD